jgi:hypothetical protein
LRVRLSPSFWTQDSPPGWQPRRRRTTCNRSRIDASYVRRQYHLPTAAAPSGAPAQRGGRSTAVYAASR